LKSLGEIPIPKLVLSPRSNVERTWVIESPKLAVNGFVLTDILMKLAKNPSMLILDGLKLLFSLVIVWVVIKTME
jgi:hypothetical protein